MPNVASNLFGSGKSFFNMGCTDSNCKDAECKESDSIKKAREEMARNRAKNEKPDDRLYLLDASTSEQQEENPIEVDSIGAVESEHLTIDKNELIAIDVMELSRDDIPFDELEEDVNIKIKEKLNRLSNSSSNTVTKRKTKERTSTIKPKLVRLHC